MLSVADSMKIIYRDLKKYFKESISRVLSPEADIPRSTDLVIVGGGLVGSAVAFFTAHKQSKKERDILVIEKDPMVWMI